VLHVLQYYINVLHCITIALRLPHVYVYYANYIKFKVFDVRVKKCVVIADCVLRE